jgi:agmatinase
MTDLSKFNPNSVSNPNNNIFGLPFTEDDATLILFPVPWEVTVSYNAGTARAAEHIFNAALQVDLFDADCKEAWKKGFYMMPVDRKILMKSDYLRKEAELYIDYISKGEILENNKFMCNGLKEINEGSRFLNNWVFEQTKQLLNKNKLVGLIGGDHSTSFGYIKALAEQHADFGILQIDAHADLRKGYEDFKYSHASIMYNVLEEIPAVTRLMQVGVRDYCEEEYNYIISAGNRVFTYTDKTIKEKMYEGVTWKEIADQIIDYLPQKVYISFDVDGLDPKLCPNTGTPVPGGFEVDQVLYLFKKIKQSGKTIIGFDLVESGVGDYDWDSNVAARILWRMCNMIVKD